MGKRNNVRNAFIIASNSREAANHTHGVSCNHHGGCREFDPNVRADKVWYCERHGGANNVARANAKDAAFANGIPGAARRARLARFRARNKAPMHPGNAVLFAQWEKEKKERNARAANIGMPVPKPKKVKAKAPKVKKTERQKLLDSLGLTEADLSALRG
tara:strand:- start:3779 stop:4258 length:480 start_codon:yes stop_codon:yes gene_type:complete